jgi:hypothetical protein
VRCPEDEHRAPELGTVGTGSPGGCQLS